ncbi:MAG: hypothetical protein HYS81_03620 [Candidatus Aenigmatarchaeota archaeon]|nr:MAG: hypothetical protein HYS81_03620 [Candidatus Aenigmarchaeota archaeon]
MNKGVLALILVGAIVIGYSLYVTYQSGAADRGVVTCTTDGTCVWTQHIHAYVPVEICGERVDLGIDEGELGDVHTHKEENVIHLHTALPYDPQTHNVTNATQLRLGTFFDSIGTRFDRTGVLDKTNGDACPDGTGTLKMFVNGRANEEYGQYVWSNRDVIFIAFDNRTADEIETELAENPIAFPTVGAE